MSETIIVQDPLLTPEETAGLLRTTAKSLGVIRCRGSGPPFVKIGRRVLYRQSAINAYINSGVRNTTHPAKR